MDTNVIFGAILVGLVAVIIFGLGAKYGAATEQEIVGTVLAAYRKADVATVGFVNRLLADLKNEYAKAYDDAVAAAEKVEKAL